MRRPVSVKDVFLLLSCKDVFSFCFLFPSCGFLRLRAGPPLSPSFHPHSWLSDFRSVHGGRSQFSRCCYLIIDLCSPFRRKLVQALSQSPDLGGLARLFGLSAFLFAPFLSSFLSPF